MTYRTTYAEYICDFCRKAYAIDLKGQSPKSTPDLWAGVGVRTEDEPNKHYDMCPACWEATVQFHVQRNANG